MEHQAAIFLCLLVFRIVNARCVQTFFQPDEYFQALEPAWQIAFGGQSGAWLSWEWKEGLRTSIHPYIFAAAYRAVDWACGMLQADGRVRAKALGAAPTLLQALAAASSDHLTWRIAGTVYGSRHAATWAALGLAVVSPWQWHCSVRTFSNSLETSLTAAAVYHFPWSCFLLHHPETREGPPKSLYIALIPAAVASYLRPTNIIIWMSVSAALVWLSRRRLHTATVLLQAAVVVGSHVLLVCAGADRLYYREWAIPPVRFLYLNLVQSLATFYGQNRRDYYVTEALPLLLTTALPFALLALYQTFPSTQLQASDNASARSIRFVFATAVVATIVAFSTIPHKEVRFIFPLLPILHVLAAQPLASFFAPLGTRKIRSAILVCGLAVNIVIAYYVSMVHQRGVIDVMHYLRHRQESWSEVGAGDRTGDASPTNMTVGFLMPCHSTPWRSHLIYPNIHAWALTCEPPINLSAQQRLTYLDEADIFYADPTEWLNRHMQDRSSISANANVDSELQQQIEHDTNIRQHIERDKSTRRPWPHYLVSFDHLTPTLQPLLEGTRYKLCKRFFNTHWHDDGRRKGDVVVHCTRR